MSKFRLIRHQVLEYEPEKKNYEDGLTLDEMAIIDFDVLQDDPEMMMDQKKTVATLTLEKLDETDWIVIKEVILKCS